MVVGKDGDLADFSGGAWRVSLTCYGIQGYPLKNFLVHPPANLGWEKGRFACGLNLIEVC